MEVVEDDKAHHRHQKGNDRAVEPFGELALEVERITRIFVEAEHEYKIEYLGQAVQGHQKFTVTALVPGKPVDDVVVERQARHEDERQEPQRRAGTFLVLLAHAADTEYGARKRPENIHPRIIERLRSNIVVGDHPHHKKIRRDRDHKKNRQNYPLIYPEPTVIDHYTHMPHPPRKHSLLYYTPRLQFSRLCSKICI